MSNRPAMPDLTKVDIAAAYKWALEDRQWLEAENASLRFKLDDERDRRRKAEARLIKSEENKCG